MIVAIGGADAEESQRALSALCQAYRFPLYTYLRKQGHGPELADELIQEFFASRVLNLRLFKGLSPERGRFRSWVLTCLDNLVRNELAQRRALKRGGGAQHVSADNADESRYILDSHPALTAEELYDRSWAESLVDNGLAALSGEYHRDGRGALFDELKGFLPGAQRAAVYGVVAERLGMKENALRAAVSKLRKRCAEHMLAQVRRTVCSEAEAQAELSYLTGLLSAE
jgi:RNA polymerase sigma-70 factor (ECF subfamily)